MQCVNQCCLPLLNPVKECIAKCFSTDLLLSFFHKMLIELFLTPHRKLFVRICRAACFSAMAKKYSFFGRKRQTKSVKNISRIGKKWRDEKTNQVSDDLESRCADLFQLKQFPVR